MREWVRKTFKRALFIPVVAIGVIALVVAIKTRQPPNRIPPQETATPVRVVEAPEITVIPRALGYGIVKPDKDWEAVAEVSGKIVDIHPRLKKGAILAKGEMLLRIDSTDYLLAIAQIEANLRSIRAELAELQTRVKNTRASIEIEQRALDLNRKDLERRRELLAKGNVSQAAVDQEERNVLARLQSAQTLQNTLNLIPSEREVLVARQAVYQAQLEDARLDLERTTIAAPFDLRVAAVEVERAQYFTRGQVLVAADGIDVAEVTAQIPLDKLITLIPRKVKIPADFVAGMSDFPNLLPLTAVVRLKASDVRAEWPARFARISDTLDPQTRTVGIIVAVDEPYRQAVPGIRPPLAKNMFVEVELRGLPKPKRIAVPRTALHGKTVYVATEENRLAFRTIETEFAQTNFVVVASGLTAGERVIISDPAPAIEGMLLTPVVDEAAARALASEATGEEALR